MDFDVSVTHDASCTRVRLEGQASAGRLLSLLQVLALDCSSWPASAVLVDLRGLQPPLADDEQLQFAEAAARAFGRRRIGVLAAPGAMREVPGLRAFDDEAAVQAWLAGA